MSLPINQWYDGYRPTAADFRDFAASVDPVVAVNQAKAYADAKIADAVGLSVSTAAQIDVFFISPPGGSQAFPNPAVTKLTSVSIDVNGTLTVIGPALCTTLAVASDASVGGALTVTGDTRLGGALNALGDALVDGGLAVNQGVSVQQTMNVVGRITGSGGLHVTGMGAFPDNASALAAGLETGDIYVNNGSGALVGALMVAL